MFKQIQKKEYKTSPIFIKWNMKKGMTITSYTSLGPSNIKPNEWKKKYNLPYSDVIAYDYSPSRIYLLNSTIIDELSCIEVDFRFLIPFIDLISFSIGRVIKFSISAGEFPGYIVCTIIVGITISGKSAFGMVL